MAYKANDTKNENVTLGALTGSLRDYKAMTGTNMLSRTDGFFDWQEERRRCDLWPYAKSTATAPKTHCAAKTDSGFAMEGVNFASQDYLSLSSHPAVKEAAVEAIKEYGVHSAGSAALLGNTRHSLLLEQRITAFLDGRETVLYPTGWSAGFAAIQGFVRPDDHVVMDVLAHSCLQEGARASTRNIHYHGHLNIRAMERRLQKIRASDTENGILLVTESLFSMHSDTPDIAAMRALCDEYDAVLLVDCAHDFGSMADDGRGHMSLQNVLHDVDIIIGSFSKTFASNGGFISVKDRASAEYLKYYSATQTFSNALSPVQAAAVLAAFDIVDSAEGRDRRRKLMDNILYMRSEMTKVGLETLGDPSAIVPVRVGAEGLARIASRELSGLGAIANLVEYPAVPQGGARFRVQVMSDHSHADVDQLVRLMLQAMRNAEKEYLVLCDQHPSLMKNQRAAAPALDSVRDAA
ncbi:aminotransferase class I/II-fold pyridoxal phosphate-dependent enzyme [Roseitalea porphyridii]|uniref:Pyridoxal phosphate-dependent aminotransferase family protein n=1 Tax=Roseitalea porphyridii TaxID=1852022 RepID=A0A4V1A3H5_9HYPH|nr:pyridoxal phosphate-dependent aminotransferase family protein [Roseitalea porphyridii]QBK29138.1 pyridoxal phosphate-dependent aminotransferase family protein [Roseitalea porphyridii]